MVTSLLKSILVAIDRSGNDTPAMGLGLHWAQAFESRLAAVGLVDESEFEAMEPIHEGYLAQDEPSLLARIKGEYKQVLEGYGARCAAAGVLCTVLEDAALSLVHVLGRAQRHDLVVIDRFEVLAPGVDGGWGHALNNLRVVENSPRPVVVAPRARQEKFSNTVLVAYDGSHQAARSLYAAAASVLGTGAVKVHVVNVGPNRQAAARVAEPAVAFLRLHKIDALSDPIESSRAPAEVVLERIRQLHAGLVVMGAYGQPVLTELFFGSTTRQVLEASSVPVFLFH